MTNFFIYSITASRYPAADKDSREGQLDKWTKYPILLAVDEEGRLAHIVPNGYTPYVLFKSEASLEELEEAAQFMDIVYYKNRGGLRVEECHMTPVVGFTNNRSDKMYKLFYDRLNIRSKLVKRLREEGIGATKHDLDELVKRLSWMRDKLATKFGKNVTPAVYPVVPHHTRIRDTTLFLHVSGLKLGEWVSVPQETVVHMPPAFATVHWLVYTHVCNITALDQSDPSLPAVPPLTLTFVRVFGHSSTTTSTSVYAADANIDGDHIENITLASHRLDRPPENVGDLNMTTISYNSYTVMDETTGRPDSAMSEKSMLNALRRYMERESPAILVQWGDDCNDILYIHRRSAKYPVHDGNPKWSRPMDVGLSTIRSAFVREQRMEDPDRLLDITHFGRERCDLLCILQKFMVSPPLDGYTIPDVHAHPKMIRDTSACPLPDDTVTGPRSPLSDIQRRAEQEMRVMVSVARDNTFVTNQMSISALCDLELNRVVERGQQARSFQCFVRRYHQEHLYINEDTLDKQYLIVRRPRSKSSYPDPPWIENPTPEEFARRCIRGKPYPASHYEAKDEKVDEKEEQVERPTKRRRVTLMDMLKGSSIKTSVPKNKPKTKTAPGQQGKTKKAFSGGFVIPPVPGVYTQPAQAVCTLDFASLYPSIVVGSVICYMRVVYDRRWLDDPRATKEYIPLDNDTCCVMITHYDSVPIRSVTNHIIKDIMMLRAKFKKLMKAATGFKRKSLNAVQLSAKVVQNASSFGFLGSTTSGLTCLALAASICAIGQWQNKVARHQAMLYGCKCVYGDTDSIMVQFPVDTTKFTTRDEILRDVRRQAIELAAHTTKLYKHPNELEFESIKSPMIMTRKKKTYAALEHDDSPDSWIKKKPKELIKGMTITKRDKCAFVREFGQPLVVRELLVEKHDVERAVRCARKHLATFNDRPQTAEEVGRYTITCKLGAEYADPKTAKACVLADMIADHTGIRPRPGRRLAFVVVKNNKAKKLVDQVMPVCVYLSKPGAYRLCAAYYFNKQFLLAVKQATDMHPDVYAAIVKETKAHLTRILHKQCGQRTLMCRLSPK